MTDDIALNEDLPEVEGFERFGIADTGGGYDWAVFGVWTKDGVFWWSTDSGCSCNSPWSWGPVDFDGHGSAHDALRALFDWVTERYGAAGNALRDKLLDYRPTKGAE